MWSYSPLPGHEAICILHVECVQPGLEIEDVSQPVHCQLFALLLDVAPDLGLEVVDKVCWYFPMFSTEDGAENQ